MCLHSELCYFCLKIDRNVFGGRDAPGLEKGSLSPNCKILREPMSAVTELARYINILMQMSAYT